MDSDYFSSLFEQISVNGLTVGVAIAFCVAALFLCLSALMSGSEVAFFSLSSNDLQIIREEKKRTDSIIQQQLEQSEYLLASIQITNIFANISVVVLFNYALNTVIDFSAIPIFGFILEIIALSFLLLLFGEIMPKIYAQKNPLKFVHFSAPFIKSIEKISHPLARLLVSSSSVVNNTIGKQKYDISVDKLSKALELTSSEISEEKEMLEEIIKFYDKTVDEIMTSRLDVEDIDIKMNFREVINFVVQSGYSRIPVYSESEDNIKGILYIKDLLPYIDKLETFRWQSLIRPAYFVPETKKIDDLLEEFRTSKIHMAIVVDEFGGTSGIVTMEDILEEIVGEISDEYDEEQKQYIVLPDGSLIFEAKILLTDFFRIIDAPSTDFGKLTDEVETLAGLLLEIKGDFPKRQEIITYEKYRFQVLEIDHRRILKVKFNCLANLEEQNKEKANEKD